MPIATGISTKLATQPVWMHPVPAGPVVPPAVGMHGQREP